MQRVTRKDLENVVNRINAICGEEGAPYYLSGAYGGWALHRTVEGGGSVDALYSGHVPTRQLYNLMHAYIRGWVDATRPAPV